MAGRHFCGGWDTTSFAALAGTTQEAVAAGLRDSDAALHRIRRLPVPVVSAVRGQAIGFGAGLLSAVHLPVAAADARLSLPEARFGFAPPASATRSPGRCPARTPTPLLPAPSTATAASLLELGAGRPGRPDDDLDSEVDALVEALQLPRCRRAPCAAVEVVESSLATGIPSTPTTSPPARSSSSVAA